MTHSSEELSGWAEGDVSIWAADVDFWMPLRGWQLILSIARLYGWKAHGTEPNPFWDGPLESEWNGAYVPAVGQLMTRADAYALVAALERALPDIPDDDVETRGADGADWWRAWMRLRRPSAVANCLAAFAGLRKIGLQAFIAHCRVGEALCIH
jgi:hypothetical protein